LGAPKGGSITLATEEHHDIRWCSAAELDALQPPMSNAVKWYCLKAIEEISAAKPRMNSATLSRFPVLT
jgi:8-oxo-dGTP pyrophosphatase MutT (NUDIX family)